MAITEQETRYGWVGERFRALVSTQSYGSAPRIAGVQIIDLPTFSDEGGDFAEIVRFHPDGTLQHVPGYRAAQMSYSLMEPGTIKAWHLHQRQNDLWFIPPSGRLLVGLFDLREDSPTYGQSMRFGFSGKARLLLIPHGVAHGVANLGSSAAILVYLADRAFDASQPDEHRLPYNGLDDILGADFWTNRPG